MSVSWLQSGIGIDMRGEEFHALCVKRMWNRIRVVDRLEIPHYRELGPQECGQRYREFLRKNGLKVPWTVVALPRSAVLLRTLSFPRAVEKELAQAVEYQLDNLHPFEEASVYWDFAVWNPPESTRWAGLFPSHRETGSDRMDVLVAMAEKSSVEETAEWCRQAGIAVSQCSVTAALLFAAMAHSLSTPSRPSPAFLLLNAESKGFELLGYAPGRPLLSEEIPGATDSESPEADLLPVIERTLDLARSELRLDPQQRVPLILCGTNVSEASALGSEDGKFTMTPVERAFPSVSVGVENFYLREQAVAFAAALTAADRRLPLSVNLLPMEKRVYQSPLANLPTYALSSLVAALIVALAVRGTVQDWLYHRYLETESQALRPQMVEWETAQEKTREAAERLAQVAGVRNSAALPLEILRELTRLLPEDVWLQQLQYEGNSLALSGFAQSASGLLQTLTSSPYFENPQFTSNITSTPEGKEVFRIGVRIRPTPR